MSVCHSYLKVNFNGGDQAAESYIEQDVTTVANRWHVLDWQQASHGRDESTAFHSGNEAGEWLELDFTSHFSNAFIHRIDITGTDGASSYGLDGAWSDVGRIRVTENGQTLNVAEIRVFSSFVDGVAVPEPASTSLLALGGITLLLRRRK